MILDWPILGMFFFFGYNFSFFSNPLSLGLILLFCSILMVWNLAFFSSTFWISYILILVLVGGLMVVFIYVSLLASNDLFLSSSSSIMLALGAGVILFISFVGGAFGFKSENLTEEMNALSFSFYSDSPISWVSKLYSQELGGLTFFLVFYLLFTLIIVVSLSKNSFLALRSQI